MHFSPADTLHKRIKTILPLGLVFLVALGVRIILFGQGKVIAADGIGYVNIARAIFHDFNFSAASHFPPLYPIFIGMFSYLTPYDEMAGKIVSTIMGSLLVIPLYLLGTELFSKRVGYIASILAALSPTLVFLSGIVLSQSTYITLLVTALYLCWRTFKTNSRTMSLATGFMFGAAYLTRPEAIIVFVGISVVYLFFRPENLTAARTLKLLLFAWGAFLILAFPYILLLHKIYGTWQLTGKSSVTLADSLGWYLNRPDLKREPGFAGLTYLDIVKNYPDFLWKNAAKNILIAASLQQPLMWALAAAGCISAFFSTDTWRRLLFLGAALLPLVIIITFYFVDDIYFSPYIPIVYMLSGNGLIAVENGINRVSARFGLFRFSELTPWALLFGIALAITAIAPSIMADRNTPYHFSQDGARYDHKLIGLMLKKQLPPKSRVMVKSGRIAFYGDFQQVDIPQATLPVILQAAKTDKARYLVADGSLFGARPQMEPYLTPLLIPQEQISTSGPFGQMPNFPGGLRLVFLYKDPASVGVAVYEFLDYNEGK
ncbi:MAG: hypothetical protein A2076_04735 [Geobacteraceae bacterium GWC2_53_11]|nr:MAG: hypothetical protein A2076_04735 [Geobacteraceae bacterium GWC2_53_11]